MGEGGGVNNLCMIDSLVLFSILESCFHIKHLVLMINLVLLIASASMNIWFLS